MKFKIVNTLDMVCISKEKEFKKGKYKTLEQYYKEYPGTQRLIREIGTEIRNRILFKGKWRAGWITPDNKLIVSARLHHYDLLYYYNRAQNVINEDDMFRHIIKDGWAQLWNLTYYTNGKTTLAVNVRFSDIDRVVNLVVNYPPMYKIFDRITFSSVVRGREIDRVVELKESGAEEVGFSLVNPRR